MVRPVALLDVDHTLCFNDDTNVDNIIYNEALINSLLKKGIKDVYLFTDMRFTGTSLSDRIKLVNFLKSRGFTVHGVITPCDLMWSQLNAEQAGQIDKALANYRGQLAGDAFETKLKEPSFVGQYPFVKNLVEYAPEKNTLGCSFDEAVEVCANLDNLEEIPELPNNLLTRSSFTKVFTDHVAERNGYVDSSKQSGQQRGHTKSLMLDFFLQNKPDWVSRILVADDNIDVIQGIEMYKETQKSPLPIHALQIEKSDESEAVYDLAIDDHLKADPHFAPYYEIQQLIDNHIKHLNSSRYNPILTSPRAKIEALELLKEDLIKAFNENQDVNIPSIIDTWENELKFQDKDTKQYCTVSRVISQHRNLFFAENREKLTGTQQFIKQLKEQFKPDGKDEMLIPGPQYSTN